MYYIEKGGCVMRVGISGTGRIGRLFIRRAFSRPDAFAEVAVINSTVAPAALAHLLKYDSVHGTWDAEVTAGANELIINGRPVPVISQRDPEKLPWSRMGIELAVDATGRFNERDKAIKHLQAGAERVLLTAPADNADFTLLLGVNDRELDVRRHRIISAASCTTNCLAPVLHALDRRLGIEQGWMTTIHAFTNDQNHLDNPHRDLRRARSCTNAIIPTTTGVGKALREILPHLADRIQGVSVRVPVQDVSLLDVQVELAAPTSAADVRELFRAAAAGDMRGILDYNELPLVSSDYIGNAHSAVIDGLSVMVRDNRVKLLAWYDNEWAYASRVADAVGLIAARKLAPAAARAAGC